MSTCVTDTPSGYSCVEWQPRASLVWVPKIWVAVLHISDRTADKIINRHHVHPDEVREVLICKSGLNAWTDWDEDRGLRWIVEVSIRGSNWEAVLYPADDYDPDVFALGSCYEC